MLVHAAVRHPGTAVEWLKALVDALNVDHIESDAAAALDSVGMQSMRELGSQIAQITFFDSMAIVKKLPMKMSIRIAVLLRVGRRASSTLPAT
jgi:hypothetical protein